MSRFSFAMLALVVSLSLSAPAFAEEALPQRVYALLQDRCASCHGPDSVAKGGLGYILDRERLVQRKQIVPRQVDASPLWKRVHEGEMPPAKKRRLPVVEQRLLRDWIAAGAPSWKADNLVDAPRSLHDVLLLVQHDLEVTPARQRRFLRYLSIAHLAHASGSSRELERHRQALAKLVNSLSWHPRLSVPTAIDEGKTVFRLDLRHYQWSTSLWERLASLTPYEQSENSRAFRICTELTQSERPLLRGDWFLATASRPPFYHEFLQLPSTSGALERLLRVDVSANLANDDVLRAGFNDSGVSQNNRLLERHDASFGAYWRSYDFRGNTDRQNLFRFPLGPSARGNGFDHDGGELIFNLPNGLQGYLLVDSLGRRIDKAPTEIVSDPQRPDRAVVTGISCMGCHVKGLLPKADQVRAHVLRTPSLFSKENRDAILALYAPSKKFQQRMNEDIARFQKALANIGVALDEPDPIATTVRRYEATLDLATASAEVGLSPREFAERLRTSPVQKSLGALLAGGTAQRILWEETFDELVDHLESTSPHASTKPTFEPLVGHAGSVSGLAFSPDGTHIATGGEDGTVRVWDAKTGKQLRLLKGHREEVRTVAWSPDGRLVASGSRDRSIRLWNAATGEELRQLLGHTDSVEAIAFSPTGKHIGSVGADGSLRIWDFATGEVLHRFSHSRPLRTLAFHPKQPLVLTGGDEGTLYLWDLAKGRLRSRWTGHSRTVYHVAFSPNGQFAASGGSGRTVRVWYVKKGSEVQRLDGHANSIVELAFVTKDTLVSASSQYSTPDAIVRRWNIATGKAERLLEKPKDRVERARFSPSADAVLLSDSQGGLRLVPLRFH